MWETKDVKKEKKDIISQVKGQNNYKDDYDYSNLEKKICRIVKWVTKYMTYYDKDYIKKEIFKAYEYAKQAHKEQKRLSWEPYITHPVEATLFLMKLKPDIYTIQACLLHDVIEDTPKTAEDIKKEFWETVAFLCEWMEKLSKVRYSWEDRTIGSLRKMFIAMAEDLRVVFIKLADRLHNMKTLKYHPKPEKREKIALETLNIYAPIADRLGLYEFKNALEEECFKILEPEDYRKIKKELRELKPSMDSFLKNAESEIRKLLDEWGIKNYDIDYRIKSVYSIYKKMQKKGLDSIKTLYDLFWIRIIVEDEATCYRILWMIHKKWVPLPKRFKDYIALPKLNWYRSLHTTVIWLLKDFRKQPTEIQIKTYEMKEYSDIWIAAHFEYKERWSKVAKDIDWVKELKELTESMENKEFETSLKIDVFKDRIFVFTPKWDLVNLPAWSTPIDFAYHVHSELWDHISIAKINGIVRTLDKELHNGDIVEIITDKNKKPNPFWLSFVKTAKAKNRIKAYIKKENKELYRERWREILNKYLEKSWLDILDKDLTILKNIDWREHNTEERLQILEQIWNFSITPASVYKRIVKALKLDINKDWKKEESIKEEKKEEKKDWLPKIIIWWEEDLPYKIWKCIKGKIPKKIVAHINKKWDITIHRRDCETLKDVNKDRLLSAYIDWNSGDFLEVDIVFTVLNKKWILKEITDILYVMDINIEEINFKKRTKSKWDISFVLNIPDYDYLIIDRMIDRMKNNLKDNLLDIKVKHLK